MTSQYRKQYGFAQDWQRWNGHRCSAIAEIEADTVYLSFRRIKQSHKGMSRFQHIRFLIAKQVNDSFLEEIAMMPQLEYLNIEVLTATSLAPLTALQKLNTLYIYGIRVANDFNSLLKIASLQHLFLEHSKKLNSLDWLAQAHHLKAIGIEGSLYSKQKIDSLKPLRGLNKLEALFMSSVQLQDKRLDYLYELSHLNVVECARFSSKTEFEALRKARPELVCSWCDT